MEHNKNEKAVSANELLAKVENAARTAHEVNRAFCTGMNDCSHQQWLHAPEWQKQSARHGVEAIVSNPDMTPEESHKNWALQKRLDGWRYGEEKDAEAKTHPCLVPYHELPAAQRAKDLLFITTVKGLLGL